MDGVWNGQTLSLSLGSVAAGCVKVALLQLVMFITGCHRSGTSLLAAVLRDFIGLAATEGDQMQAALDNPAGFQESNRLVALNDELLAAIGCRWSRPPLLAPVWDRDPLLDRLAGERNRFRDLALEHGWLEKDPRLCLTYPAYLHLLLRRVPVIAAIRQPQAVAGSLFARNGLPLNAGLCLWFLYNHHLTDAMDAAEPVVPYEHLLQAGVDPVVSDNLYRSIASWLDSCGHPSRERRVWTAVVNQHIQPSLDRASAALPASVMDTVNPALLTICEQAYAQTVGSGSNGRALAQAFASLPKVVLDVQRRYGVCPEGDAEESARLRGLLDQSHHHCQTLEHSLADAECRLQSLHAEVRAIRESSSWRLTAPLRSVMKRLKA